MKKVADLTIQEFKKVMGHLMDKKIKEYIDEWEATIELMDKNIVKDYLDAKSEIKKHTITKWKSVRRNV
jgi:hypothetical protein